MSKLQGFAGLMLVWASIASAQTREQGPWWPHPIWGADDVAGSSNWITPEKIVEAVQLVKTGKVYELGELYENGMSLFGQRTFSLTIPGAPTIGPLGANMLVANDEFVCGEIGQVGTQFDGLGHIGQRMQMADGTFQDVYYNGFTGEEIYGAYGLEKIGVEHVKPFITRGILIDIAAYKGVTVLDAGYEVTLADVRGALERQGMSETTFEDGDAILFRFGGATLWGDAEAIRAGGSAGINLEVARWLVGLNPALIGGDWAGNEVSPYPDETLFSPVHQELLTKNGIFNLESLDFEELAADEAYEFLFIFTPIRYQGATGSPARPLAIR